MTNIFEKTLKLFRERNTAEDWSQNLMEASAGLETDEEWNEYMRFLAYPAGRGRKVTGDSVLKHGATGNVKLNVALKETVYPNGTECIIHVQPELPEDDEKICTP